MDYSLTGGASASTIVQQLTGNQIYTVTFKGAEAKTIESKSGEKFNILTLKFSNDEGVFEDTIFELKAGDEKRKANSYGYDNPSALEELGFKAKHLLAAVNPKVAADIQAKGGLKITGWEQFTSFVVKHANTGVGKETQIKLLERTDAKGVKRANFPGFVLGISKKGELYPKTNFIGDKLAWTAKEKEKIDAAATAAPTNPDTFSLGVPTANVKVPSLSEVPDLNLDFDIA